MPFVYLSLDSLDSLALGALAGLALPRPRDRALVALACAFADLTGTAAHGLPGGYAVGSVMASVGAALVLVALSPRWRDRRVLLWLGVATLGGLDNLLLGADGGSSAWRAALASLGCAWVAMAAVRWAVLGGAFLAMRALALVVG